MKIIFTVFLFFVFTSIAFPQRTFKYNASITGQASSKQNLPFWATANKFGIIPDSRGGIMQAGVFSDFNTQKTIQFSYGVSGAGYLTQNHKNILIDELYFNTRWKKIQLNLGMVHPEVEYNGVSSTNGNIVFSNNTRTLPGYNLKTDYIKVPFTGNVLSFKFNLADYRMIDKRYVDNVQLHNKSFFINIKPWYKIDIIVGVEHWAQWAGTSPIYGKQPSSFHDYLRVFCAREGGAGSTWSDSVNVLGNHLGREHLRINYHTEKFTLSFYHDIPFDDRSGIDFDNAPDGVYALYYGAKNKKQWVSDFIYEFFYTKDQSGPLHDRPATPEEKAQQDPSVWHYGRVILGGNDQYFNNGEYQSGWTYYGKTIGTPFITPKEENQDGITLGVYNNRILAHHIGVKGYIANKIPYKMMLSYTLNYGTYGASLPHTPHQFSFGLEAGVLQKEKSPFHIDLGLYGDFGKLLKNNVGISVKISRNGIIR
ncbi:MAG: capsule assembly Wzi family protein [Odoribacter sp.]